MTERGYMAKILWVEKQIDYEPQGIMSMSAVLKAAGVLKSGTVDNSVGDIGDGFG
jgi:hypothetical protein